MRACTCTCNKLLSSRFFPFFIYSVLAFTRDNKRLVAVGAHVARRCYANSCQVPAFRPQERAVTLKEKVRRSTCAEPQYAYNDARQLRACKSIRLITISQVYLVTGRFIGCKLTVRCAKAMR